LPPQDEAEDLLEQYLVGGGVFAAGALDGDRRRQSFGKAS